MLIVLSLIIKKKISITYLEVVIWFTLFTQLLILIALVLIIQIEVLYIGLNIFGLRRFGAKKIFYNALEKIFIILWLFGVIVIV